MCHMLRVVKAEPGCWYENRVGHVMVIRNKHKEAAVGIQVMRAGNFVSGEDIVRHGHYELIFTD